jgi:hypothetical protein
MFETGFLYSVLTTMLEQISYSNVTWDLYISYEVISLVAIGSFTDEHSNSAFVGSCMWRVISCANFALSRSK